MKITVSSESSVPPYEQVKTQIEQLIAGGSLQPGAKLPPVRQLAGDLRVAPGTVARAYKELEAGGLLVTRRAAGTRVADSPNLTLDRQERLAAGAREYLMLAQTLGVGPEMAAEAVKKAQFELDSVRS